MTIDQTISIIAAEIQALATEINALASQLEGKLRQLENLKHKANTVYKQVQLTNGARVRQQQDMVTIGAVELPQVQEQDGTFLVRSRSIDLDRFQRERARLEQAQAEVRDELESARRQITVVEAEIERRHQRLSQLFNELQQEEAAPMPRPDVLINSGRQVRLQRAILQQLEQQLQQYETIVVQSQEKLRTLQEELKKLEGKSQ